MAGKVDKLMGGVYRESDAGAVVLTEYDNTDPTAPSDGVPWIKRTVASQDGIMGLYRGFGAFNYAGDSASLYELSVKTIDSGIKRVSLT